MAQWDFFREEVKRQRTTQEFVASKAGMSLNTLQGKISKDIEPKLGEALALSMVMKKPAHDLFPELAPKGYAEATGLDEWVEEHHELIDDLKIFPPETLEEKSVEIHALAELHRRRLGKISTSG